MFYTSKPTFAQNTAVDTFKSSTDQGGLDKFLGWRSATVDFACCHHGTNVWSAKDRADSAMQFSKDGAIGSKMML